MPRDQRRRSRSRSRSSARRRRRSASPSPSYASRDRRSRSRSRRRRTEDEKPAKAVELPAAAHRHELLAALRAHQVVICVGETGSGKTTQLPQYLLDAEDLVSSSHSVVITQPRRVATVSVAQRVAEELAAGPLGGRVGYSIRFDDRTSTATRLKFVTDGVLVRECLRDPLLSQYAVVMLDEAHERSLHTDILFGLLKQVLATRPDLRLLVTSATLDTKRFAAFFNKAPIVTIPGRSFPVDIFHAKQMQIMGTRGPISSYLRSAVETTLQVHNSEDAGHVLVFLTGQQEIEDACKQLRRLSDETTRPDGMKMRVVPLYGALSGRLQREIFAPVDARRTRKVIVATNIAETSLTIDGVRFVVDAGFTKQKVYNPQTQMEALVVVPVSKVSAQQRAGRAGRTAPGKCFRLYAKESYAQMLDESIPEIQRTNLANTVLYLKVLGIQDVLGFAFLDPPEEDAMLDALQQLYELQALDDKGVVTPLGRLMAEFPLEPKLARALMEAVVLECADEMARIVAMLSVENMYVSAKAKKENKDEEQDGETARDDVMLTLTKEGLVDDRGDQLTYLRVLTAFERVSAEAQRRWCEDRDLQYRALSTASSIKQQLLDILRKLPADQVDELRSKSATDDEARRSSRSTRLRRALCAGFFTHAARRCAVQTSVYRSWSFENDEEGGDGRGKSQTKNVQLLHFHPLSTLNYVSPPLCCIYQELVATSRPFMRHAVQVETSWVRQYSQGRAQVTVQQLYALSGREAPVENVVHLPKMEEKANAPPPVDESQQQKAKEDAVAAARARFLARKQHQRR
ncbi:hypothetical protein Poli38472_013287 [Pythium oligandrum]|uniref:RNA helicase n=1 Tax=Pythium oligandrum TaxID=41045 RepID=A0A8K1FAT5_PYTOL|nr:hypothetical protein Poli38472_013287 [Pythium oligandrum]|eukprot:TMW55396.1 hypothetical protein Poli38472_013287 [Pythium oligandrum]